MLAPTCPDHGLRSPSRGAQCTTCQALALAVQHLATERSSLHNTSLHPSFKGLRVAVVATA